MKIKTGDVLFVEGSKWNPISWLIKFVSGGKFSHVAICIADDLILETEYSIRSRVIDVNKTKYLSKRKHEIVHVNFTKKQLDDLDLYILQYIGKKYDFGLILKMFLKYVLRIPIWNKDDDEYICSELVAELLLDLGAIDNEKTVNMSPNELYEYLRRVKNK